MNSKIKIKEMLEPKKDKYKKNKIENIIFIFIS